MPYALTVDPRPGYLRIVVTGENTAANVAAYIAEIAASCREQDCAHALIIEDLHGPGLGTLDIFNVITRSIQLAWSVMRIIAYVDVNPQHEFKSMKFAETVARNRGVFVRLFPGEAEAQAWIEEAVARK
jgi:hypothetical protein